MINENEYQRHCAETSNRINTLDARINHLEYQTSAIQSATQSHHTIVNATTSQLQYYKHIIDDLSARIEALEKHTLIHMAMPTKDELNTFLDGGDAH